MYSVYSETVLRTFASVTTLSGLVGHRRYLNKIFP